MHNLAFAPMGAAEKLGLSLAQDAQDELDLADSPRLAPRDLGDRHAVRGDGDAGSDHPRSVEEPVPKRAREAVEGRTGRSLQRYRSDPSSDPQGDGARASAGDQWGTSFGKGKGKERAMAGHEQY